MYDVVIFNECLLGRNCSCALPNHHKSAPVKFSVS
jgi:hypothetical protein